MRGLLSWLLLLILVPRASQATTAEIPLPELEGSYSWYVTRTTTVALPSRPTAVHSVSLRLNGTSVPGITCCNLQCSPSGLGLYAYLPPDDLHGWYLVAYAPNVPGEFEWTGAFVNLFTTSWDFLLNGEASVSLEGPNLPNPACNTQVPAAVTVTGVTLIVDGDFDVPVQVNTWGRIKGLYR